VLLRNYSLTHFGVNKGKHVILHTNIYTPTDSLVKSWSQIHCDSQTRTWLL